MFNRRRAIGLDIGPAAVRALVLEGRPGKVSIAATAAVPVAAGHGNGATVEAIHACLARVRADGQPVVVELRPMDVEAPARLNAALLLGRPDPRELLVALDLGEERAVLCLLSDRGPVVVRHLDVGASATGEQLRGAVRRVADEIRT